MSEQTNNVILYTSHCGKCESVRMTLEKDGIPFSVVDDESIYLPISEQENIFKMPFASIDGEIMTTEKLDNWITSRRAK